MSSKFRFRKLELIGIGRFVENAITKTRNDSEPYNGITPSCISCDHFSEHGQAVDANRPAVPPETCRKFNQRPPARIIALACPDYSDNEDIPF